MALVEDLFSELKNKNILFEIDKDPEDNRIFILTHQSTVLAIGVEVADEINSSTKFGISKGDYLKRLNNFYFQLAEPLNGISKDPKKDGKLSFLFFFLSKSHIVCNPFNYPEWTCYEPEDNLNKFFIKLSNHPELRTEEQKMEDEIEELKSNIYSLEQKVIKYTNTNEKLEQSLSYVRNSKETLEKENKEMKEEIYSENIINEKLQKEIDYLKSIVKAKTISRLSDKQIEYLKNRGGFPLRIELELMFPSVIIAFYNSEYRQWGSSGDWLPLPITDFLEIDEFGNASILTTEQLTKIPNFPGFISEKCTMIVHLIGSISITMEDFNITT
jgi:hypothetical protein